MEQAVNQFNKGMLLDSHPMIHGYDSLSDALNASYITMNGNELMLQNEMGNARVDNAYLPNGYQPVGIKEYGGIIYVASYNPITNKSLIGSFPSPERRTSSLEQSGDIDMIKSIDSFKDLFKGEYDSTENIYYTTNTFNIIIPVIKKDLHTGDKFVLATKLQFDDITNINNTDYVHDKLFDLDIGILDTKKQFNSISNNLPRYDTNGKIVDTSNLQDLEKRQYTFFVKLDDNDQTYPDSLIEERELNKLPLNTYSEKTVSPLYFQIQLNVPEIVNVTYNVEKTVNGFTLSDFDVELNHNFIEKPEVVLFRITDTGLELVPFDDGIFVSDEPVVNFAVRVVGFEDNNIKYYLSNIKYDFTIDANKLANSNFEISQWRWTYQGNNRVLLNFHLDIYKGNTGNTYSDLILLGRDDLVQKGIISGELQSGWRSINLSISEVEYITIKYTVTNNKTGLSEVKTYDKNGENYWIIASPLFNGYDDRIDDYCFPTKGDDIQRSLLTVNVNEVTYAKRDDKDYNFNLNDSHSLADNDPTRIYRDFQTNLAEVTYNYELIKDLQTDEQFIEEISNNKINVSTSFSNVVNTYATLYPGISFENITSEEKELSVKSSDERLNVEVRDFDSSWNGYNLQTKIKKVFSVNKSPYLILDYFELIDFDHYTDEYPLSVFGFYIDGDIYNNHGVRMVKGGVLKRDRVADSGIAPTDNAVNIVLAMQLRFNLIDYENEINLSLGNFIDSLTVGIMLRTPNKGEAYANDDESHWYNNNETRVWWKGENNKLYLLSDMYTFILPEGYTDDNLFNKTLEQLESEYAGIKLELDEKLKDMIKDHIFYKGSYYGKTNNNIIEIRNKYVPVNFARDSTLSASLDLSFNISFEIKNKYDDIFTIVTNDKVTKENDKYTFRDTYSDAIKIVYNLYDLNMKCEDIIYPSGSNIKVLKNNDNFIILNNFIFKENPSYEEDLNLYQYFNYNNNKLEDKNPSFKLNSNLKIIPYNSRNLSPIEYDTFSEVGENRYTELYYGTYPYII